MRSQQNRCRTSPNHRGTADEIMHFARNGIPSATPSYDSPIRYQCTLHYQQIVCMAHETIPLQPTFPPVEPNWPSLPSSNRGPWALDALKHHFGEIATNLVSISNLPLFVADVKLKMTFPTMPSSIPSIRHSVALDATPVSQPDLRVCAARMPDDQRPVLQYRISEWFCALGDHHWASKLGRARGHDRPLDADVDTRVCGRRD